MPSKGKYIQGKQVSRWEADSDNIDIEYKNLEGRQPVTLCRCSDCFVGWKGILLKVLSLVLLLCLGMLLGYLVRRTVHDNVVLPQINGIGIQQDYDLALSITIQEDLNDTVNIEDNIKTLSKNVRLAGVGTTNQLIKYIREDWQSYHFDSVKSKLYNVTLSYPVYTDDDYRNRVLLRDVNNSIIFQTEFNTTNVNPEYLPFSAYSPSGNVTGNLIYANYGRKEDFLLLKSWNVTVAGTIAVIRYGFIHPASKVKHAEDAGAIGVIFYPDPADFADNQTSVFPDTWWLPEWAVPMTHVRYSLTGDPCTPDYPSLFGFPVKSNCSSGYPKIPVQPISYSDARKLLRGMSGKIVPNDWFGGLRILYCTGPGHEDNRTAQLIVTMVTEIRTINNIIGVIRGKYERDKYVIVGAHFDAWTHGAVDAGSGYAVLRELARAFSSQVLNGWRPRRSIMFALWDASKYGHVGSYEWMQEYHKELSSGAVAYIDLDMAVRGNYSFYAEASPLLYSVLENATKSVSCPDPDFSHDTVFHQWRKRFLEPNEEGGLRIPPPKGDGDHSAFLYHLGIPTLAPAYTYNVKRFKSMPTNPACNTLEDTKEYIIKFIDPDFVLHTTLAQITSDIILQLADTALLPLDVRHFGTILKSGETQLISQKSVLEKANLKFDLLSNGENQTGIISEGITNFVKAVAEFYTKYSQVNKANISEFDLYLMNDQLLRVSRAFIIEKGLPGRPHYRNVLVAPHPEDLNTEQIFPGVLHAIGVGEKTGDWSMLQEQVAILVMSLRQAADILKDTLVSISQFDEIL
ncbi:hypothetical protein ScPMuIL_008178 [Solemya velum]